MLCDDNADRLNMKRHVAGSVCTRSRLHVAAGSTGMLLRGPMAADGRIDRGHRATQSTDTVSYTHLTLPTNREV